MRENKRFLFSDRRLRKDMSRVPFLGSNRVAVRVCRRMLPDRRINSIHGEWIEEIVIR
jgi:hypothetical protein